MDRDNPNVTAKGERHRGGERTRKRERWRKRETQSGERDRENLCPREDKEGRREARREDECESGRTKG